MTGREYGPTAGIKPLRAAVANLYNANYRQGMDSQYSWENVCIVPGGRAGLIRIAAVLGNAYLGFFIPDYTAYNEMLSLFKNVSWNSRGEGHTTRRAFSAALPILEHYSTVLLNTDTSISSSLFLVHCPARTSTTFMPTRSPKNLHEVLLSF